MQSKQNIKKWGVYYVLLSCLEQNEKMQECKKKLPVNLFVVEMFTVNGILVSTINNNL